MSNKGVHAGTAVDADGPSNSFTSPGLLAWLEAASPMTLDTLTFGAIAMTSDTVVEHYNLAESRLSGLPPSHVIGRKFFVAVAQCVNNALVADRFYNEAEIDTYVHAVFTFHAVPHKVRLRLLKHPQARRIYMLVDRRW